MVHINPVDLSCSWFAVSGVSMRFGWKRFYRVIRFMVHINPVLDLRTRFYTLADLETLLSILLICRVLGLQFQIRTEAIVSRDKVHGTYRSCSGFKNPLLYPNRFGDFAFNSADLSCLVLSSLYTRKRTTRTRANTHRPIF
ncbi:uncharacterized protein LOC127795522 isoform X4 [Diospyros lotus]|uniref:uncharacterized protein LOC127795522 isoform X4 n=1 Tax=Diospyros lotus TaxID=55363 RepID=UPI00224CFA0C|nr:uncharacterized protein LOC127795522 isoform X4 [Diospyros lotus]